MKQILAALFLFALIGCDFITPPISTSVTVETPESKPSNFETNDSSFLKIRIQDDNYKVLFLNRNSTLKSINELDAFLQKNQDLLDKNKVLVSGFEKDGEYKDFINLLLKYGISKFYSNKE